MYDNRKKRAALEFLLIFLSIKMVGFQWDQSDKVTTKGRTKKRTQKVQTAQELLIMQKNKEKRYTQKNKFRIVPIFISLLVAHGYRRTVNI